MTTNAFVWAAPGRMSGEVCIGHTRIPTATFRALRDERGLDIGRMNALYPYLSTEQIEVALWWEDRR